MIEKWKERVDKGRALGTRMTDLCKAFGCLHHGPLITTPTVFIQSQ